jgi:hypothetical protein
MGHDSSASSSASVTRRTLLGGALGGAAVVVVGAEPALAASEGPLGPSVPDRFGIRALNEREVEIFDEDFARVRALSIPAEFEISGAAEGNVDLEIRYDDRIVLLAGTALVSEGKGSTFVELGGRESLDGRAVSGLRVAAKGDAQLRVALPLTVRDLYPVENVGASQGLEVIATDSRGRRAAFASSGEEWTAVSAWGLELFPAWLDVVPDVSASNVRYRCPSHVRVRSVGPAPSPSGTVMRVEADARFVDALSPTVETAASAPAVGIAESEGRRVLGLALPALAPGEELLLALDVSISISAPRKVVTAVHRALVAVDAEAPVGTHSRPTGRTVVVDVTDSGSADVPLLAMGKI